MITIPRIYPILDTETAERRGIDVEQVAAAWLDAGSRILQLRHKAHWGRAIFGIAARIAERCRASGALLIIDDRADFARLLGAGLHVGQDDLSPRDARAVIGPEAVLGFSSHNPEQLCAAANEPVDYVALGPIFPTASKQNPDPVVGLEQLRHCRALTGKPLVAIGGITRENARAVLAAGAGSVAVIAGLFPETCTPHTLRDRMREWQDLLQ